MKNNTIKAKTGGVVITGNNRGNITTNVTDKIEPSNDNHDVKPNKTYSKTVILAAIITAIGAVISGILIATSNWFSQ